MTFPEFSEIQWIVTKSKSSMATRGITHLATDTLSVLVIQIVFLLLCLGRYLLPVTTLNRYQPTDSSGKLLFTTVLRNISIVRYRISLVTILLLDLVMIHWIRWIQRKSFRENSIVSDEARLHSLRRFRSRTVTCCPSSRGGGAGRLRNSRRRRLPTAAKCVSNSLSLFCMIYFNLFCTMPVVPLPQNWLCTEA